MQVISLQLLHNIVCGGGGGGVEGGCVNVSVCVGRVCEFMCECACMCGYTQCHDSPK